MYYAYTLVFAYAFFSIYKQATQEERRIYRIFVISIAFSQVGAALTNMILPSMGFYGFAPYGTLVTLTAPLAITYAVFTLPGLQSPKINQPVEI
jgi:hypothetical protein